MTTARDDPPPFDCAGVVFVSHWVPGDKHHNGGHYERRSTCGRIVARKSDGEPWHEVTVDGGRRQARLTTMKSAMLAGIATLERLKRSAAA